MRVRVGVDSSKPMQGRWQEWFAWYPVYCGNNTFAFFEFVERRQTGWVDWLFFDAAEWDCRTIPKPN